MEIFIQSRGFSREHDYTWLKLNHSGIEPLDPPLYSSVIGSTELRDFSVVLGRWNGQICLLVAGLKSGRKDIAHRPIRNSVMWISQDSQDEPAFRALAAYALKSQISSSSNRSLQQDVDKVIQVAENYGFQSSFSALKPEKFAVSSVSEPETKLEINDDDRCTAGKIRKISEQIEKCYLPRNNQNLIFIFTSSTSLKNLDEPQNWRVIRRSSGTLTIFHKAMPSTKSLDQQNTTNFNLIDFLIKTIFPSLVSAALTAIIFLAPPIRNWLTPPCSSSPSSATVTFSGQPVFLGLTIPLLVEANDSQIKKLILIQDDQEQQEVDSKPNEFYKYPGFQTEGKHHLTLRGLDGEGNIIGEQKREYIVQKLSGSKQ